MAKLLCFHSKSQRNVDPKRISNQANIHQIVIHKVITSSYTKEGMNNICLDLVEVFIFDHDKMVLLPLRAHQSPKPRAFTQLGGSIGGHGPLV